MNLVFKTWTLGALAAGGLLLGGIAQARSNGEVYWSVGIAAPGYPIGAGVTFSNAPLVYAQPVYVAPPAVFYAPPVVYAPGVVYLQPGPLYLQPAAVYYIPRWRRGRHH